MDKSKVNAFQHGRLQVTGVKLL